ncbi:hypothetical protein K501DRAFT_268826 [Backusella circina FSU 941]|nr:hypothetical protein K501DRAFT_268826 [Backusella circina FSU 941]
MHLEHICVPLWLSIIAFMTILNAEYVRQRQAYASIAEAANVDVLVIESHFLELTAAGREKPRLYHFFQKKQMTSGAHVKKLLSDLRGRSTLLLNLENTLLPEEYRRGDLGLGVKNILWSKINKLGPGMRVTDWPGGDNKHNRCTVNVGFSSETIIGLHSKYI